MSIIVTDALKIEDLTVIWQIFNAARLSTPAFKKKTLSYRKFRQQIMGEKILAAKINNEIVGFAAILQKKNFIHHLFVDPRCQSKGIGRCLINVSKERFGLPLELKCLSANYRARSFYEKNGFIMKYRGLALEGAYIHYALNG